jgi:uncharacterized protein YceK
VCSFCCSSVCDLLLLLQMMVLLLLLQMMVLLLLLGCSTVGTLPGSSCTNQTTQPPQATAAAATSLALWLQ